MKPADAKPAAAPCLPQLLQLPDRPIAFHRCFVPLTGSVTAALMLSQAIYWQQRTKDEAGWWYKTRDEWTAETGMKRKEQEGARKRLRKLGILHEDRRGVPATMWYRVDETRLLELLAEPAESAAVDPAPVGTFRTNWKGQNVPTGRDKTYQQAGTKGTSKKAPFGPTFKEQRLHRDYTETTTTTTTTPNPSSSSERAAEPETARGSSGGDQDPNPENPDGNHGVVTPEPNEEKPVAKKEAQTVAATEGSDDTTTANPKTVAGEGATDEQRPELTYPAKLTEREREDIAAQVHPLPAEIAQQMLDVIEAKIKGGQVKTSPAAVLRGIARKYQADASSFDPSGGFHVAEARRRRAEADARARAEAEAREREREREAPRGVSPEARAVARQSLASIRRILEMR